MRISPELKKLIEKYRCVKDTEGMSPAKVYKLVGENENLYLKMTDSRYKGTTYDVEREKDMMLWLEGKLPVPKVLHFERHDGWSNLLMSEADGVLCSEEYEDEQSPEKIIELYAECIRLFHSIDISDCPYTNSLDSRLAELDYLLNNDLADVDCENWEEDTPFKDPRELYDFLKTEKPEEELVFSHGDLGDSNIFVKDGKVMIAIASWAKKDSDIKLQIDWEKLGIDADKARLTAPDIKGFQEGFSLSPKDKIKVPKDKGFIFILE